MKAYRYMHRAPGQSTWTAELFLTALNTEEGAKNLVAEWNLRDTGKCKWTYAECYPTDIDYPGELMPLK